MFVSKTDTNMRNEDYSIETLFKALADRTRLRLIHLLGDNEVCVCVFVEVLQSNQPKVSRHLAYLRRAGIVAPRRDGKWMHYRLVEPTNTHAARIFREVRKGLADNPEMRRDKLQLKRVHGADCRNRSTAISGLTPNRTGKPITPVPLET